jgi:hypothetical protein
VDLLAEAVRLRTDRRSSCSRSESTQSPPQRTDLASTVDVATPRRGRNPSTYSARGKLLAQGIRHVPDRVLPRLLLLRSSSLSCNFSSCTPASPAPPPLRHLRQVVTKLRYHVCGTRVRPHSAPFFCDEVRTACPSCPRCRARGRRRSTAVERGRQTIRAFAAQMAARSCSSPAVAGQRRAGALWPSCATRYRARLSSGASN